MAALVLFFARGATALWMELPPQGTKCVSEEIQAHAVVIGQYDVHFEEHTTEYPTISAKISTPYGKMLHESKNVTEDHFGFTTTEAGNYLGCFWVESNPHNIKVSVNIDWRTGIAAKDWESVAKQEKIEGVELELRKLEFAVDAIRENMEYLKSKEEDMRETSERTNARVAWLSIMSIAVCISTSVVQLWRLKTYFRKKKLI
ncbi:unnamed protein product [Spirodela intermedia]|uniref:GOLD domain-containing protein n=1 Tax=Spirodela intermedia TaxID=51605 RepID=A0A7I8INS1_SPIIN|nr:unnamed protein product [Spirodela intermedia]CAA6659420.1 unnamed protein product [Spirodela intermedia]